MIYATEVDGGHSVELLSAARAEAFWPGISKALDRVPHTWEDYTKEYLHEAILRYDVQVWGVGIGSTLHMLLLTKIATFPTGNILEIFWAAGEGNFKAHEKAGDVVDAALERFAKENNCRRIDVYGRFGWEKVLKKRGFKRTCTIVSRPVIHRGLQ